LLVALAFLCGAVGHYVLHFLTASISARRLKVKRENNRFVDKIACLSILDPVEQLRMVQRKLGA
jgi:hypothetical protein